MSLIHGRQLKFLKRNLIKELFHSRLLDMRLAIANSALRAISYPTSANGIIVYYYPSVLVIVQETHQTIVYIFYDICYLYGRKPV